MTPLYLQLLMPAAVAVGVGIVLRRFSLREFPAFVTWMLWEVFFHAATFNGTPLPAWGLIAQDGVCAAVICETIRDTRLKVGLGMQARVLVCALAGSRILSTLPELTEVQSWYLFRSYFLWAAFVVLGCITIARWKSPVLERKVTRIKRIGVTLWVLEMAVSGSFVKGGIGYLLFPYTMTTWRTANQASYWAVIVTVPAIAMAMYMSVPGRKRAALNKRGKVVCGRIEQAKAA